MSFEVSTWVRLLEAAEGTFLGLFIDLFSPLNSRQSPSSLQPKTPRRAHSLPQIVVAAPQLPPAAWFSAGGASLSFCLEGGLCTCTQQSGLQV